MVYTKVKLSLFLLLTIFGTSLLFSFVSAQSAPNLRGQINNNLQVGKETAGLGEAKPQEVVARVIQVGLTLVGMIFTALVVWSGYNILTAGGDESKIEKAKKTITACIIGLAITLAAYSITTFIGKAAVEVTNNDPQQAEDTRTGWEDLKGWFN